MTIKLVSRTKDPVTWQPAIVSIAPSIHPEHINIEGKTIHINDLLDAIERITHHDRHIPHRY